MHDHKWHRSLCMPATLKQPVPDYTYDMSFDKLPSAAALTIRHWS
jgi:hypothetical protein